MDVGPARHATESTAGWSVASSQTPLPIGQPGDVPLAAEVDDHDVTTSQDPLTAMTEHPSGHRRVLRYASIIGVSLIVLTLAFWWSPVIGVILTITALLVLAGALIPGTTHHDPHSPGPDWRNDVSWWL